MAADLVTYGILALVLLFVFFAYLMIRRTVTGFRQGVEEGQNRR
jgi:preprotein translocase subunit YajC